VEKCSVVIATYGDSKYRELAESRALPSAEIQNTDEIILFHETAGTASSCRNKAAASVSNPWIVFLDADDQLESDYVDSMLSGTGDLRYPSIRTVPESYKPGDPLPPAKMLPKRSLLYGNYMVIGTMVRKRHFDFVGGFQDVPTWEDWYLFLQLTHIGASNVPQYNAVYRVYDVPGSRNKSIRNPGEIFYSMRSRFAVWARAQSRIMQCSDIYKSFLETGKA